jgi:hypothetical protein
MRSEERMMKMKRYFLLLCCLGIAVTANASWLDQLQELADPESKERQILSGTTQVLSSSKDIDYATERTIGEALALERMQRFVRPVDNES